MPGGSLGVLSVGAALLFTAYFMTVTLAPLFGVALGASPAAIGVVISAAYLFPFFLAIPVGAVVDAIGPKPMLIVGTGLLASAPVWVAVSPSLAGLVALQVLAGLGQLVAVVAAQATVARQGSGRVRESAFGWYGAFVSLGQLLGPVTAGVLVDLAGFRAAFLVAVAVATAGTATFAAVRVPTGRAAPERTSTGPEPGGTARAAPSHVGTPRGPRRPSLAGARRLAALARLPTLQVSLWVSATVMIVLVAHTSFLPAFLDGFEVPASIIGIVISARSAASVAVRPFLAGVVSLFGGRLRTFLVMLSAAVVGVAAIAAAPNLTVLLASSLLLGVATGVAQPLTMAAVVEEVEPRSHGTVFGARITANRAAQFVAPLLLGLVAQAMGYAAMFVVAAAVVAATVVGLSVRRRRYRAIDVGVR